MRAVWNDHLKVVEKLLKAGANVDAKNVRGPRECARWKESGRIAEGLIRSFFGGGRGGLVFPPSVSLFRARGVSVFPRVAAA
jgi:hypothetical protein